MPNSAAPILPGSTIGILGSGQLGRMFTMSARTMGYRVHTLSPDTDTPTGQVADKEIVAEYDNLDAVREFARAVDVVTFEFENVPSATTDAIAGIVPVRPSGRALDITQNRLREKTFLKSIGVPHAQFESVTNLADLERAVGLIGLPAILKTAGFGYDGKGQFRITQRADIEAAWEAMDGHPAILERVVSFEFEFSVVAARGIFGDFAAYPPIHNVHQNHILSVSQMPAPGMSSRSIASAFEIVRSIFDGLELIGLACVEFFFTAESGLIVNEIAPRPHNSGHLTIEGNITSQFEQQLRAVCGLRLGSVDMKLPAAAMMNVMGDMWPENGEPDWLAAASVPAAKIHLYGKHEARAGRKMGHVSASSLTPEDAFRTVLAARNALQRITV